MEQFPDGAHVRLRSREHGGYLRTDEDGMGEVSLTWAPMSMDMVWKVHHILHDDSTSVLLHNAAHNGRYLAASSDPAPPSHPVVLGGDYDDLIVWRAVESGSVGYVLLGHVSSRLLLLRAIDRQQSNVSIDVADNQSTMVHWKVETLPASLTARLPSAPAAAMEQFPHGALVRLQSRVHLGYLHADEDGMAVSLCRNRDSINVAWKACRILHDGSISVRLQSAAHGRYLAVSSATAPPGYLGHRVGLADCDRNVGGVQWEAVGFGSGDAGYVLLRHVSNRLLRANGRYGSVVSMDVALAGNYPNTTMHWKIDIIPTPARASPSEVVTEQFPDGAYVRLRDVHGGYLHANEDGVGVNFLPRRRSLNVVWRVHRILYGGTTRLLLQSAVYGRYLGLSRHYDRSTAAPTLVYYNDLQQNDLQWVIHHGTNSFLLANAEGDFTTPVDGTPLVPEFIPTRRGLAPGLPAPSAQVGLIRRLVIYIEGDEYGNIEFSTARALTFQGRSVSRLQAELADRVGERIPERIAICLWAGSHGRLIPLISDLPANNQTIELVLFESWTRAGLLTATS